MDRLAHLKRLRQATLTPKILYVGNLPLVAEEAQLFALFGANGRIVQSVKILNDPKTGRSRGYGFVKMASEQDAEEAIDALHGHDFLGRALTVNEARGKEETVLMTPSGRPLRRY
jgi:cold-inducible RNA-binding protein